MTHIKQIVKVSSSFEEKHQLFATLKKYARWHDNLFAYWEEFAFTVHDVAECDAVLVFNTPSERITTITYPDRVLAFMMEPGVRYKHPWMFDKLDQYAKVFSPVKNSDNTVVSHGFLGWSFMHSWPYLNALDIPQKKEINSFLYYFKS